MNHQMSLNSLLSSLMAEFEDDHVGLWSIIREVRRAFPTERPENIRSKTLSLVRFLMEMGSIEAGFPKRDGRGFEPWRMKPVEVVDRIASEWKQPAPDPTIGEIVWFTTPSANSTEIVSAIKP